MQASLHVLDWEAHPNLTEQHSRLILYPLSLESCLQPQDHITQPRVTVHEREYFRRKVVTYGPVYVKYQWLKRDASDLNK